MLKLLRSHATLPDLPRNALAFITFLTATFVVSSVCFASENEVSLRFEGGVAPYEKIEWVWSERDGFGSLGVTRTHAGQLGSNAVVALRGQGALSAAALELRGCLSLPHLPATAGGPILTLTTELVEEAEEEQTALAASGAAADCLRAIVLREAGEGFLARPYEHPFWVEGEFGTLRTNADLPAELWVDGRRTGRITPVSGLRLEAGPHTLSWGAIAVDWRRTEGIVVEAGRTVTLNVYLEPSL
jgi:hypothetical protein